MLMNSSYTKLRKLIIPYLHSIIKLPDDVFLDAKVETIIFIVDKNQKSNEIEIINYQRNEKVYEIDKQRIRNVSSENWKRDANLNFNLYINEDQIEIIKKIEDENSIIYLEEIADFTLGITPYDKYKGHSDEIIKNRGFHSKTKLNDLYKPLIKGDNVRRYSVDNRVDEYIKYGDWLGAKREEKFFKDSRIIIRQIVSGNPLRIYAGYTEDELYFTQIGFGVISKDNNVYNNKFILAVINSLLINFFHKFRFLDLEKELFQKILIANCRKFPIRKTSMTSQQPFISKADQMLSLNCELQELSGKFIRLMNRRFEMDKLSGKLQNWYQLTFGEFLSELKKAKISLSLSQESEWETYFTDEQQKAQAIQQQIAQTDREIDQMVYQLYGLTEEEIAIVEA